MLVPEREGRISDYGSINGTEAMSIAVIKLRYKEDVHEMKNISLLSTVSDFKSQVADCTGIPVERQRLVIGGKRMEPNTLALQDFKLRENDNIYLFPLPLQQAAAFTPSANNSSAQQVQRWINVPQITLAARELELCCQELVAVSDFFVVMDALYFMGAGKINYCFVLHWLTCTCAHICV
ncbi:hypothetical protein EON65_28745 [archaeon]|nr:MAG: hypothetical protein EON65_28745 [archaeon]